MSLIHDLIFDRPLVTVTDAHQLSEDDKHIVIQFSAEIPHDFA